MVDTEISIDDKTVVQTIANNPDVSKILNERFHDEESKTKYIVDMLKVARQRNPDYIDMGSIRGYYTFYCSQLIKDIISIMLENTPPNTPTQKTPPNAPKKSKKNNKEKKEKKNKKKKRKSYRSLMKELTKSPESKSRENTDTKNTTYETAHFKKIDKI